MDRLLPVWIQFTNRQYSIISVMIMEIKAMPPMINRSILAPSFAHWQL